MAQLPDGSTFFIDHINGTSSWVDPRVSIIHGPSPESRLFETDLMRTFAAHPTPTGGPLSSRCSQPTSGDVVINSRTSDVFLSSPPPPTLEQPRTRHRVSWRQLVTVRSNGGEQREHYDLTIDADPDCHLLPSASLRRASEQGARAFPPPPVDPRTRIRLFGRSGTVRRPPRAKQRRNTPAAVFQRALNMFPLQFEEAGQATAAGDPDDIPAPVSAETSQVAPIMDGAAPRRARPSETGSMSDFEFSAAALGPTPMYLFDADAAFDDDHDSGVESGGGRRRSSLDLDLGADDEENWAPRRRLRVRRRHSVDLSVLFLFRRPSRRRGRLHSGVEEQALRGQKPIRSCSVVATPGFRDSGGCSLAMRTADTPWQHRNPGDYPATAPPMYDRPPAYAVTDDDDDDEQAQKGTFQRALMYELQAQTESLQREQAEAAEAHTKLEREIQRRSTRLDETLARLKNLKQLE